ncbi:hypothetical protein [Cellulophaga sp. BC115SP]|uniref:hypothetical protein n=1 Tax=Cellulophaga sp. BC115SP TaxID=2683263 RepID=UPI00141245EB|nr:hypothetical protein [Cellulophaga sp. BC115SP]NBB31978.1 hypothetical protein [Cellulophaga sp. BC115SP]
MYIKINQITDSKLGFSTNDQYLFVPRISKKITVYEYFNNSMRSIETPFDLHDIVCLDDNLFILTDSYQRSGFIYEIEDLENINLFRDISNYVVIDRMNDYLKVDIIDKTLIGINWLPALYNWREDIVLWKQNYGLNFVSNYIIAKTNHFEYSRLSIDTGEIIWTYSFEGYPKVKNQYGKDENVMLHNSDKAFTGVIDKQLWVSLNTSQHLVLDIDTGEQLALLGQPYKYNKDYYTQKVMSGGQIDVKQEKIISLGNCQYREINTNNFEATFIDLREEFDKHGVSSVGDTRFDDDYIYFYDKIFFGAQPRNKVAVLDRKTLKVVWVHDFAQYGTFPMQMEKTDRHLLVLDSGGTLHIFEKEQD